jgi:hypothetical protein
MLFGENTRYNICFDFLFLCLLIESVLDNSGYPGGKATLYMRHLSRRDPFHL